MLPDVERLETLACQVTPSECVWAWARRHRLDATRFRFAKSISLFQTLTTFEVILVDFSDALKAKIESMSGDELAATETRRLSREADRTSVPTLDALWERASGDNAAPKAVTVKFETGASGMQDILRIDHGTTFHESIILSLPVYRLIAGGAQDGVRRDRFVVNPGGPGYDKVSVDRAALAAIVARDRPVEIARSQRLVGLEQRAPAVHLSTMEKIAHFEEKWHAEAINLKIDGVISKVASRAVMLLTGRDHVALWVRKDDMTVGPDRIMGSALAAAIVKPGTSRTRDDILVAGFSAEAGDAYLKNSFGSGPERTLILDVGQIRKIIAAMTLEETRAVALALFEKLIDRSDAIGRERCKRTRFVALRHHAARI